MGRGSVSWNFWFTEWNGQQTRSERGDSEFQSEPVRGSKALGAHPGRLLVRGSTLSGPWQVSQQLYMQ